MPAVIYAPEADDDLEGIVDYIARDKPTASRAWLAKVRATCQILAENPQVGEVRGWSVTTLSHPTDARYGKRQVCPRGKDERDR